MLKFHQLEVLIAIVDAGGLRAAARALHLSQAAVVKSLKALEEAAGVPLLVRQSRGVDLTAAGKSLLVRAQAMSRQMRLAEEELLAAQGKLGGTVRVALTPFVALTCLGAAYEWFRHRFPSVQVHFAEGLVHRSIPRLRAGSLDFAVVAATQPLPSDSGLTHSALGAVEQRIVVRRDHRLARAATGDQLAAEEWILTHALEPAGGSKVAAMFASAGLRPPQRVVICDALAALSLQRSTDLVGIMPVPILEHPWAQGIVAAAPTELQAPPCDVVLLQRSDVPLTPAAEFLAHCLQTVMREGTPACAGGLGVEDRSGGSA